MNTCPVRVQLHENKALHMLNKTIRGEYVRMCVRAFIYKSVLKIPKDSIFIFSNYNLRMYSFL
jgi:hypothetical protein